MINQIPDKWGRVAEFPSDNIAPLVKLQRQVTVSPYPFAVVRVHHCLTSWTNSNWDFQVGFTRLCNPSNLKKHSNLLNQSLIVTKKNLQDLRYTHLWGESFDVVLLLLQDSRRYKQREIAILDLHFLDFRIKESLAIEGMETKMIKLLMIMVTLDSTSYHCD